MTLADDVQVYLQSLWGSIGWATGAAFGIALADPNRRTIFITGEGSNQLTANEIGNMGRYGANPIGKMALCRFAAGAGCADWTTARVETLGDLDAALKTEEMPVWWATPTATGRATGRVEADEQPRRIYKCSGASGEVCNKNKCGRKRRIILGRLLAVTRLSSQRMFRRTWRLTPLARRS
jgi:Thiamine pyrophosphate enzyme, C-terminal TPP binding domain